MNHRFRSEGDNDGRTAPTDLLCLPLLLLTFPENLAPLTGGIVCFAPILECYSQLSLFIIVFRPQCTSPVTQNSITFNCCFPDGDVSN